MTRLEMGGFPPTVEAAGVRWLVEEEKSKIKKRISFWNYVLTSHD